MPKNEYDNKQYQRNLREKRRSEGWKEITVWLDSPTLSLLDEVMQKMKVSGSKGKTEALTKALQHFNDHVDCKV